MLHYAVEDAFDTLLCTWRKHHDTISKPEATIAEMGEARVALDVARARLHRLRIAMYPEPEEMEAVVDSVFCDSLDMVVHFRWDDRHPDRPGTFLCSCGNLVEINWSVTGLERT